MTASGRDVPQAGPGHAPSTQSAEQLAPNRTVNGSAELTAEPYTLQELSNGIQALVERLDSTEDHFGAALEKVSAAVLQLREKLDALLKTEGGKDVEARPWAARATHAQWDELIAWVDWMQTTYGTVADFDIYPCWPAHHGVVEELAGLHHSWKRSMIVDEQATKNGSNDLTAWHDRWFWPFLQRAKGGHYRMTNCKRHHVADAVTSHPTDRAYLPFQATPTRRGVAS